MFLFGFWFVFCVALWLLLSNIVITVLGKRGACCYVFLWFLACALCGIVATPV